MTVRREIRDGTFPERTLYPSAEEFARIGLGLWHHGVDRPAAEWTGVHRRIVEFDKISGLMKNLPSSIGGATT